LEYLSRKLGEIGEERPIFMNALINIADQKLLPLPDGVLVRDKNNQGIGSVGITGIYLMKMSIVQ